MMEQVYTYDKNRNLTDIAAANTPWYDQSFEYDALNRLTQGDGIYGTIDYTYDKVGNRITRVIDSTTDTYSYQTGTNRLSGITGANPATYTYEDNGNITDIGTRIFTYNQNNRLIEVAENLTTLGEYEYNGLGQRITKTVDSATTVFHYDFDGNIIGESDDSGTFSAEYLYMGSNRLAMVDVATGDLYYYLNNSLGTPILMTDSSGTVVWEAFYKPFGNAAINSNSTVVNNFRFAGQYYDVETGLHYNWHRYYDPATGRYLTPDPIRLLGGINLYSYTSNNPINRVDTKGLFAGSVAARALVYGAPLLIGALRYATGIDLPDINLPDIPDIPSEDEAEDIILDILMADDDDVIVGPWPGSGIDTRTEPDIEDWRQQCIELYSLCIEEDWPSNCGACLNKCRAQHEWPFHDCPAERRCQ